MTASGTHVIVRWTDGSLSLTGWGIFVIVFAVTLLAFAIMDRH